jgi:hypothetical protein
VLDTETERERERKRERERESVGVLLYFLKQQYKYSKDMLPSIRKKLLKKFEERQNR